MMKRFSVLIVCAVVAVATVHAFFFGSYNHHFRTTSSIVSKKRSGVGFGCWSRGLQTRTTPPPSPQHYDRSSSTLLWSGYGIATNYSWKEEPYEMEVSVRVPPETSSKDIIFQCRPRSIDLRMKHPATGEEMMLLDGNRPMRGRVVMDGTFWHIADADHDHDDDGRSSPNNHRIVTVQIEKSTRTPRDDFDIVEYDWGGVYPKDDDEVTKRYYAPPEELNVKEYCAKMGVDVDNINMSLVDKSMFSDRLNLTQSTMDQLVKAGYLQEVTEQDHGRQQFTTDKHGNPVPLKSPTWGGKQNHHAQSRPPKIPFLDTKSPWDGKNNPNNNKSNQSNRKAMTIHKDELPPQSKQHAKSSLSDKNTTAVDINEEKRSMVHEQHQDDDTDDHKDDDEKDDDAISEVDDDDDDDESKGKTLSSDPIDLLTVNRLKDILRQEGLKVSGNKAELKERLRNHVTSLL